LNAKLNEFKPLIPSLNVDGAIDPNGSLQISIAIVKAFLADLAPPPNMQKCASSNSASFFVLPSAYSQDPCTDFYDQYLK